MFVKFYSNTKLLLVYNWRGIFTSRVIYNNIWGIYFVYRHCLDFTYLRSVLEYSSSTGKEI